ncbi:uncharacterized protein METZ01_LOCUS379290 [marine metagenome]|uniref:Uncharacterized protein n=1 Tax=marine metagenome TaxID=408172 RepID=A0A382TWL6_9ZZZZ
MRNQVRVATLQGGSREFESLNAHSLFQGSSLQIYDQIVLNMEM